MGGGNVLLTIKDAKTQRNWCEINDEVMLEGEALEV